MLEIQGSRVRRTCDGASRRDFLRAGAVGMLGLTLADWLKVQAHGETQGGKAKSVIQLWMGGGPTHLDTFDPKPEAGQDYCGPLKNPAATNVPGIRICELLPLMAKQADKYSIIRSFTHPSYAHETGTYIVQTGTMPTAEAVYPSIGSVVALKKGFEGDYKGLLPPYITLTSPLGRYSDSGFLGTKYKTFAPGGDPNDKGFRVEGLAPPGGVSEKRLQDRRTLLQAVDSLDKEMEKEGLFKTMDTFQEKAYGLLLGDAKKAFDMAQEKDDLRERYGRNHFGQCCLLARRLVEAGVPFITVNMGGWDTHTDNFGEMKKLLPVLDKGFSTLLEDLAQRGLLQSTIVVWYGEFGRTPKVDWNPPWNGGRHHYPDVYSCVVAGGGFRGGAVVGSSDDKGEKVKDRPVHAWDLSASIYKLLGIDHTARLPHPQGCVAYVTPLASGTLPSGGLLKEIM
jgi:hypothetical protein